ncbi:efflux RND transporter periplasmic adaptor subunit [Marinobacterium sediminicola]|uniref:Membrane fusion protein, multidrug efflux system n=1 Tax=Marinobacterium sediminicola TaxID=518898 RepID=A0ABY1RWG6_9GAMM|nr:efflux RND transporter periplasmic adaptor subunit [Marinobacterium sediminicola]ULG70367.1 efflux RND transporter periplasmic adaptor subunit [Marinobacterium sediminicola]SMR69595.1 membrane fusion protein, multidrug efflux system [Marinobacterium sediminicola]
MKTLATQGRVFFLACMSIVLVACGDEANTATAGARPLPPVTTDVSRIERRDITLDKTYSSLLRSDNEVTLVARVTGTLESRQFEQGDQVSKGQLLYTIEPEHYEAQVKQRDADLQSARAELARAGRDAERYASLLKRNSVSRQQYDQALAEQQVARARVAQAEAALASARIDLGYTRVTAPVDGRIGLSQVNLGNLVNPGTELVTVTPLDPLEVRFQVPLKDALELRSQLELDEHNQVRASLEISGVGGQPATRLQGTLDFLDVRVDQRTSTVQASATFSNPDAQVLPGQFARVSIEGLMRYNVIAVPEIAVTQGLMGPQVFVVDAEGKARARSVELGELAGDLQIIIKGLESGDTVVTGDPSGIKPGTPIKPNAVDVSAGREGSGA